MTDVEFELKQARTHISGEVAASNGIANLAEQWASRRFISGDDATARDFRAFAQEVRAAYKGAREKLQGFIDSAQ